jgi:ankyrin repeat protein
VIIMGCSGPTRAEPPHIEVLVAAARTGDLDTVRKVLEAGTPIDGRGPGGESALLAAVNGHQTSIGLFLLERGASVNVQADNRDTPWLQAGALGRTDLVRAMTAHGPDLTIRNRYGGNALIPACERGHVETVRVLLSIPIDVDHVNDLGWTCLLEAVILGSGGDEHREVVRLVLASGADPNLADRGGITPLNHARSRRQAEIAALLSAAGAR